MLGVLRGCTKAVRGCQDPLCGISLRPRKLPCYAWLKQKAMDAGWCATGAPRGHRSISMCVVVRERVTTASCGARVWAFGRRTREKESLDLGFLHKSNKI